MPIMLYCRNHKNAKIYSINLNQSLCLYPVSFTCTLYLYNIHLTFVHHLNRFPSCACTSCFHVLFVLIMFVLLLYSMYVFKSVTMLRHNTLTLSSEIVEESDFSDTAYNSAYVGDFDRKKVLCNNFST